MINTHRFGLRNVLAGALSAVMVLTSCPSTALATDENYLEETIFAEQNAQAGETAETTDLTAQSAIEDDSTSISMDEIDSDAATEETEADESPLIEDAEPVEDSSLSDGIELEEVDSEPVAELEETVEEVVPDEVADDSVVAEEMQDDELLSAADEENELLQETDLVSASEDGEPVAAQSERNFFYTNFTVELEGLIVRVSASNLFVKNGSKMYARYVSSKVYEDQIGAQNYGKVLTGAEAVELSFIDGNGKEFTPIGLSVSIESKIKGADSYSLYRVEGDKVRRVASSGKAEFDFYTSFAETYVLARFNKDNKLRAEGKRSNGKTTFALKEGGTDISVSAPNGAFYGEISMTAEAVSESIVKGFVENTLGNDTNIESITAYDISFHADSEEDVEPNKEVEVKITTPIDADNAYKLVHIDDYGNASVVEDAVFTENCVTFISKEFSVYAVVKIGSEDEEARATVKFWGADTADTAEPLATFYVKNSDTREELEEIVYDPGPGELSSENRELFGGWKISDLNTESGKIYTADEKGVQIDEIWDYLADLKIHEGDVVNIYAMIFTTLTVTYFDENNKVISTFSARRLSSDRSAEHIVNMPYTPAAADQNFEGWNVYSGADNIVSAEYNGESVNAPYPNGTILNINGDVILSVSAPHGHWLVFDSVEKGATYIPPQFVKNGENTVDPEITMQLVGHEFGGWYADSSYSQTFTFGQPLNDDKTIYAKWNKHQTANYTVIIWKQNVNNKKDAADSEKTYDFGESITLTGNVDTTVNTVSAQGSGNGRYARVNNVNKVYPGFHLNRYDTDVTIDTKGNSIVNVYYDRNLVTLTFDDRTSYPIEYKTVDYRGTSYQLARITTGYGSSFLGDYPIYDYAIQIEGKWYKLGDDNEERPWDRDSNWRGIDFRPGGSIQTKAYIGNNNVSTSISSSEYIMPSGDQVMTGLYGSTLSQNGYTWPTNLWWWDNIGSGYYGEYGTGTRTTFLDAFKLSDDSDSETFYGFNGTGTNNVHFLKKDSSGTGYTEDKVVTTSNGTFYISDKYNGYKAVSYSTNNSSWTPLGEKDANGYYGSVSSYTNLYIRYDPLVYNILYMDGVYVDGDGNPVEGYDDGLQGELREIDGIAFDSDISSYNKGKSNYFEPTYSNFTFGGWYIDDKCTHEYTFTTMQEGVTVYAKWILNQYRVFLHPNAGRDASLNWGSTATNMSFRVSSGSKVNTPYGTRIASGYEMVGWYLDSEYSQVYNAKDFILNDTSVKTPYDKSECTELDKWGDPESGKEDVNEDKNQNRFWITKKLDLYALWRQILVGAEGIGVIYDDREGSGAPQDTSLYQDTAKAIVQGAATPPENYKFVCWVLQTWDGNDYVDTNIRKFPGDDYTVHVDYAKIVELPGSTADDPKFSYTIQFRAEYAPVETPKPTHITWYANFTPTEDLAEGVSFVTKNNLQVNYAVDILPSNTFTRAGYKFIGWARVDNNSGAPLSPKNLGENNLFLKYIEGENGNSGHYEAKNNEGVWETVTQVAADEKSPIHDLYAVWEGQYTIYHSGKDKGDILVKKVDNIEIKPYEYADTTLLYGGYYVQKMDEDDVCIPPDDLAAYDGTNWAWITPGETVGYTPEAGDIIYLKEVPKKYLRPRLIYTLDTLNDSVLRQIYPLTAVDDLQYRAVGFEGKEIKDKDDNGQDNPYTVVYDTVVYDGDAVNSKTIPLKDIFTSLVNGYLTLYALYYMPKDTTGTKVKAGTFSFTPYFITPDGLKVVGYETRLYTISDDIKTVTKTKAGMSTKFGQPSEMEITENYEPLTFVDLSGE